MEKDMTIECSKCGKEFVWTAGEQKWYAEKDMTQPKKCKDCRAAAKLNAGKNSGNKFNKNSSNRDFKNSSNREHKNSTNNIVFNTETGNFN